MRKPGKKTSGSKKKEGTRGALSAETMKKCTMAAVDRIEKAVKRIEAGKKSFEAYEKEYKAKKEEKEALGLKEAAFEWAQSLNGLRNWKAGIK